MSLYVVGVFITTFTHWESVGTITVEAENEAEAVLNALDIGKESQWFKRPEVSLVDEKIFVPMLQPGMDFLSVGLNHYRIVSVGDDPNAMSVKRIENIEEEKMLIGFLDPSDEDCVITQYPVDIAEAIPVYASLYKMMQYPRPNIFF